MSFSSSQEIMTQSASTQSNEQLEWTTAHVYYNNLLMDQIIKNITCLESKKNFERAAFRCQELSKRIVPSQSLRLFSYVDESKIVPGKPKTVATEFRLGTLLAEVTCQFNFLNKHRSEMSKKIAHALKKLVASSGDCIGEVIVGQLHNALQRSYSKDEILITKDILECFEQCKNLKKLSLTYCTLSHDAVEHLASEECTFKDKLTEIFLDNVRYLREDVADVVKIVGRNIRVMNLRDMGNKHFETELAQHVEDLDLVFEKAGLEFDEDFPEESMQPVLDVFRNRSERLDIRFCNVAEKCDRISAVWNLAKNCKDYDNVTALNLRFSCKFGMRTQECQAVIKCLGEFENLEHLGINLNEPEDLMDDLIEEMGNIRKLRYFSIDCNMQMYEELEHNLELFSKLPDTVENLNIGSVLMDDEILDSLIDKLGKNLKVLKIGEGQIFDALHMFNKIIHCFENLEELIFHTPVPMTASLLNEVIRKTRIRKVEVAYQELPNDYEDVLKDNFFKVTKIDHFSSHRLTLEERNLFGTLRIPEE